MTGHFKKYRIDQVTGGYDIVFTNKDTGVEIHMSIPEDGLFDSDPSRKITRKEVGDLAEEIVDKLDEFLH